MTAPKHHGHKAMAGKKKLRRISVEPTMNGGYVANHDFNNSGMGEYQEPEQHAFSNAKDLHAHLQKHIPVDPDAGQEAEEPEA